MKLFYFENCRALTTTPQLTTSTKKKGKENLELTLFLKHVKLRKQLNTAFHIQICTIYQQYLEPNYPSSKRKSKKKAPRTVLLGADDEVDVYHDSNWHSNMQNVGAGARSSYVPVTYIKIYKYITLIYPLFFELYFGAILICTLFF